MADYWKEDKLLELVFSESSAQILRGKKYIKNQEVLEIDLTTFFYWNWPKYWKKSLHSHDS